MVIITAFQAEDDSSILLSRSLLIDEIMKETSFKAGVIGGVFTFLALFATTSKASINESATNGDYKINRVQYEFINELTIYKVLVFQVLSMCLEIPKKVVYVY